MDLAQEEGKDRDKSEAGKKDYERTRSYNLPESFPGKKDSSKE